MAIAAGVDFGALSVCVPLVDSERGLPAVAVAETTARQAGGSICQKRGTRG